MRELCGINRYLGVFLHPKTERTVMKKGTLLLLMLLFGSVQGIKAQADSIRFSLLTCAPGSEIYSLFGHTALRYENLTRGQDLVFNYGMFSFNTPNFVYRFVKGETDYQLGITPYPHFEGQYAYRGSSVWQQELNLTAAEKLKLARLLEENYRPANRTYRYNYFYDNCTTRARDRFEQCIDGKVVYPERETEKTFREILHEYTRGHEWSELGIDLCLGSEADEPIDLRKQMFAPFYMLEAAKTAVIVNEDGTRRPLVLSETKIVDVEPEESEPGFPLSPMTCALLLLALSVVMAILQYRIGKVFWVWDVVLFGAQGVAGCIIAFLFFFSVHPTVGSNLLILLFNPLPLLYLPVMVYRAIKGKKDPYHCINVSFLTIFVIIMPAVRQMFNVTVVPLALSLLVCSAGHLLLYSKQSKKTE